MIYIYKLINVNIFTVSEINLNRDLLISKQFKIALDRVR